MDQIVNIAYAFLWARIVSVKPVFDHFGSVLIRVEDLARLVQHEHEASLGFDDVAENPKAIYAANPKAPTVLLAYAQLCYSLSR